VLVLLILYKDELKKENYVRLSKEGKLITRFVRPPLTNQVEKHFIKILRKGGFLSHPRLIHYSAPGTSVHYAGTLPMSKDKSLPYRTEADTRLSCAGHVYVADAAVFPDLPAKNHTLTIMAIAMRTADKVADALSLQS